MPVDVTENYIRIRVRNPDDFQKDSFRTVWLSKKQGIKSIMGKPKNSKTMEIQSYLFDKTKWTVKEAKDWVDKHKKGIEGAMINLKTGSKNRTFLTAKANIVTAIDNNVDGFSAKVYSLASSNSTDADRSLLMFLSTEMAHEGENSNGDIFTKDELIKSYKTAKYKLVDIEHNQNELVGAIIDADLSPSENSKPLGLLVKSVLWKNSPYLVKDDRLNKIWAKYSNNDLYVSMECYFDKAKCPICDFETADMWEYEIHRFEHMEKEGGTVGRILSGVEWAGEGILIDATPADHDAYVSDLLNAMAFANKTKKDEDNINVDINNKTDDSNTNKGEGMIKEKLKPEDKSFYTLTNYFCEVVNEISANEDLSQEYKIEKYKSTTTEYINLIGEYSNNINWSDSTTWTPYIIDAVKEAIITENTELKNNISAKDTEILELKKTIEGKDTEIKNLTDSFNEEVPKLTKELTDKDKILAEKEKNILDLTARISALEKEKTDKSESEKIELALKKMEDAGISLSGSKDSLVKSLKKLVSNEELMNSFVDDFIQTYKVSVLENESLVSMLVSRHKDTTSKSVMKHLDEVEKKYKQ